MPRRVIQDSFPRRPSGFHGGGVIPFQSYQLLLSERCSEVSCIQPAVRDGPNGGAFEAPFRGEPLHLRGTNRRDGVDLEADLLENECV